MCYDISFTSDIESILNIIPGIQVQGELQFEPVFQKIGMAYPKWPIVINNKGSLELHPFTWGPVPAMLNTIEKIKKQRQLFLNCRSEKVLEEGRFWNKVRHQRCLIPVNGFFEHRKVDEKKTSKKQAYFIKEKNKGTFFIAGLWIFSKDWDTVEHTKIPTFTLITRVANAALMQIHNDGENSGRMPLMLTEELAKLWISAELTDQQIREILDFSIPTKDIEYWPVNSIRSVHPNDESVIARVDETVIPPIVLTEDSY